MTKDNILVQQTLSANGRVIYKAQGLMGKKIQVFGDGTFGSGNAKVQVRAPNRTNWIDVSEAFTANFSNIAEIGSGCEISVELAGSTSPSLAITMLLVDNIHA
jgi:hypothetical protein